MSFSLEMVRTPEERAELDDLGLTSPITNKPVAVTRWVVDRERGMYLVSLGGGGNEIPWVLVLVVKGFGNVRAEGREHSSGEYRKNGVEISWELISVTMTEPMRSRERELRQALEDALTAYGSLGNVEVVKTVRVRMAPTRFI
jgi:hypothetical protein